MIETFRKLFQAEEWMPAKRVLQRDQDWWNRLQLGCQIRFGTMSQPELSGKHLLIDGNFRYRFGNGDFVSHTLSDGSKPVCQMIVANVGSDQVYLALSRKLQQKEIDHLFSDEEWQKLPDLGDISRLYVREHTPGLRDWITMQYRRQIVGVSGEKTGSDGQTRNFLYSLFVSEAGDRALEIERYADNSYDMYATLYRPISDIVQISQERRPAFEPEVEARRRPPAVRREPLVQPKDGLPLGQAPAPHVEMAPQSAEVIEMPQARRDPASVQPSAVAQNATAENDEAHIACNIRVAAKVIDEALRNDMQLSDVVRRILGLPVAMDEEVHFQIPLTTRDYQLLAARYGISFENRAAIRAMIVEDLVDFTGEHDRLRGLKHKV